MLDEFCAPYVVIDISVDLKKIEHRIVGRRSCSACGNSFHVDFIGDAKLCPQCGGVLTTRKDDNAETVKERLMVYATQTEPLIDYYSKQGKLVCVDGNLSVEQVFSEIVKVLG
jgi:adenylate kinase